MDHSANPKLKGLFSITQCPFQGYIITLWLSPATNDTLNLLGAGCCRGVNTPRFGSPMESHRSLAMKGSLVIIIIIKKKNHSMASTVSKVVVEKSGFCFVPSLA